MLKAEITIPQKVMIWGNAFSDRLQELSHRRAVADAPLLNIVSAGQRD